MECNCTAKITPTISVTKEYFLLDQGQCCCLPRVNSVTKVTTKSCNCTKVPIVQNQTCTGCVAYTQPLTKATFQNCTSCADCNSQTSPKLVESSKCKCSGKNCACAIDYFSLCPPMPLFDDLMCGNMNKPPVVNTTANLPANCKWQYEYLVAVVANSNTNSSVLMSLQSYQLSASTLLQMSSTVAYFLMIAMVMAFY